LLRDRTLALARRLVRRLPDTLPGQAAKGPLRDHEPCLPPAPDPAGAGLRARLPATPATRLRANPENDRSA